MKNNNLYMDLHLSHFFFVINRDDLWIKYYNKIQTGEITEDISGLVLEMKIEIESAELSFRGSLWWNVHQEFFGERTW